MDTVVYGDFGIGNVSGQQNVGLALALEDAGHRVVPMPRDLMPPVPAAFSQMLTRDPRGPKDVLIATAPGAQDVEAGKRVLYVDRLDRFADLSRWDALVSPYPVVMPETVDVIPRGLSAREWPHVDRDWSGPLRFLVVGREREWVWKTFADDHPDAVRVESGVQMTAERMAGIDVLVLADVMPATIGPMQFMHTGGVVVGRGPSMHESSAVMVDPQVPQQFVDGMRAIWDDRKAARRVSDSAAAWSRQYEWEKVAEKWNRLLSRLR